MIRPLAAPGDWPALGERDAHPTRHPGAARKPTREGGTRSLPRASIRGDPVHLSETPPSNMPPPAPSPALAAMPFAGLPVAGVVRNLPSANWPYVPIAGIRPTAVLLDRCWRKETSTEGLGRATWTY